MIIQLQGTLFQKQAPYLGINVNGVGYGLQASLTTVAGLPELGQQVTLHTHLLIREDAHQLYGFTDIREREMFLLLIKINGVGPKLALAILSTYEVTQLVALVAQNDLASLTRISGIGKKTAERLLIELRDKVDQADIDSSSLEVIHISAETIIQREAAAALQALGYKPNDAEKVIRKVYSSGMDLETTIRCALKS